MIEAAFALDPNDDADDAGSVLEIDLAAIQANYRHLCAVAASAECAAVVKADAYGLGLAPVARTLLDSGCRTFFVATLAEGIELRRIIGPRSVVAVLNGAMPGTISAIKAHALTPVLNDLEQIDRWIEACGRRAIPAMVQLDTGMSRMGLSSEDVDDLISRPDLTSRLEVALILTHLGCADTPDDPTNEQQLALFDAACAKLPPAPRSIAASSGIFLSQRFHKDMVRPGAALYGLAPVLGAPNPMQPVVRLRARVLQVRSVQPLAWVGYGRTHGFKTVTRLATLAIGYADGLPRSAGNRGVVHLDGRPLPIVGRVSMDSVVVDLSAIGDDALQPGDLVDVIGPDRDTDRFAAAAETSGYEILTRLGRRFGRRYAER